MSILIKGMKMPTSCDDCFLPLRYCPYAMKPNGECPLVPVPPHGRLIDADRFSTVLMNDEYQDAFHILAQTPTIIPAEEGE